MGEYILTVNGKDYKVNVRGIEDSVAEIEINGKELKIGIKQLGEPVQKTQPKRAPVKEAPKESASAPAASGGVRKVNAPLPGVILNVMIREGETVKEGQDILIMEAMKMENSIQAPFSGKVVKVNVKRDDTVQEGDLLVEIGS